MIASRPGCHLHSHVQPGDRLTTGLASSGCHGGCAGCAEVKRCGPRAATGHRRKYVDKMDDWTNGNRRFLSLMQSWSVGLMTADLDVTVTRPTKASAPPLHIACSLQETTTHAIRPVVESSCAAGQKYRNLASAYQYMYIDSLAGQTAFLFSSFFCRFLFFSSCRPCVGCTCTCTLLDYSLLPNLCSFFCRGGVDVRLCHSGVWPHTITNVGFANGDSSSQLRPSAFCLSTTHVGSTPLSVAPRRHIRCPHVHILAQVARYIFPSLRSDCFLCAPN